MTLHLSARVAWHMDGWNGRICHNPAANTYCVGQYSYPGTMILERRDLEWEHEQRGRCCSELEAIPPCIYSINAFGTKPLTAFADPPEFFNDDTRQRRWGLPPATVCIWPYNERTEVELLLRTARQIEAAGPDIKAEALLDWIYTLQREEGDPDLKLLIFTEFVPTQEMLRDFLAERGFSVVCLNGSMDMAERQRVQTAFVREARILVSTDAGGEGLNLQFCHVVVNYDIPWNPMRLEQRIGRVDRIGQRHTVRALNFLLVETVEHRVREVIEEKLAVILEEFGVDKTGDLLDSAQAGRIFDDLYVDALLWQSE